MSIADNNRLCEAERQIAVLRAQLEQVVARVVVLEKQAVSDNTLHLKGRKRGD
jgi:hypothetical protein